MKGLLQSFLSHSQRNLFSARKAADGDGDDGGEKFAGKTWFYVALESEFCESILLRKS